MCEHPAACVCMSLAGPSSALLPGSIEACQQSSTCMAKIGRNEPCPCGSGKKYKKCHGNLERLDRMAGIGSEIPGMRARHEAKELQRTQQQGLGKPIIAARTDNGFQLVAVNNRLHYSKNWKTFHDFLIAYLKDTMGVDWGNAELRKPLDQRHPILRWYDKLCEQQRVIVAEPGVKVSTGKMTGAVASFMYLAYDLYALAHNADLQSKLIERLRNEDLFPGARYEVHVAALLTRAGFTLAFENENDRRSSHCEFTATSRTGKSFSVEAKRAESGRVVRQLFRALKKAASHPRIVFIDLNQPDSMGDGMPAYVQRAFDQLRRYEMLDPQASRLPPAYVVMTNTPWEHHLDRSESRRFVIADGFHIPDFKMDQTYPSLRAAVDARAPHMEMHSFLESMREHSSIPSTFDGENPELAFSDGQQPRLTIGKRLRVPDGKGAEVEGVLASAVVMEAEKVAACAVNTDDGRGLIIKAPLSDEELAAWKRHPATFFGEVSRDRKCETALDLYDFFMETYSKSSKEQLLKLLAGAEDFDTLVALDQPELARVLCERYATNLFAKAGSMPKPPLETRWRRPSTDAQR